MKALRLLGLTCLMTLTGKAQSKTIDNIVAALSSAEVFISCSSFKKEMTGKLALLKADDRMEPVQFNNLRLAYTEVYEKHDAFLKSVKASLVNVEDLNKLVKDPDRMALLFAASYQQVKESYENNFLVQFNSIHPPDQKGVPIAVLLKLGIDAFRFIANSIRNHRIAKESAVDLVLPIINERLFNKMKLEPWSELNIPEPANYTANEAVVIPSRTINTLNGSILFLNKTGVSGEQPVSFSSNEGGKDMKVVIENAAETVTTKDEYFSTENRYPIGSKFRLEVDNTGFTYIMALNSTGISLLHPFNAIRTPGSKDSKDFSVTSETTPPTGALSLPENDNNGNRQYFTITKNAAGREASEEEVAILLSKSELELGEITEKLDAVNGNLSERITMVFGEQKIDKEAANIAIKDNRISFNGDRSDRNIIPMVFKILKD